MQRLQSWLLVLFVILLSSTAEAKPNTIDSVRVWSGSGHTRIVLDLSQSPQFSYFRLSNPHRLVIDLAETTNKVALSKVHLRGKLVGKLRRSTPPKPQDYRLVIELAQRVKPAIFPLPAAGKYGPRLVIDLPDSSPAPNRATPVQKKAIKDGQKLAQSLRPIIIAIDAGHGGKDTGAIGPDRIYEKNVTLPIAKRLAKLVNSEPGLKAVLIRSGDYFVPLDKRSELARESKADMLISIHADGFISPTPRGASVWVLSERRASREVNRWLDQSSQPSELLGGAGEVLKSNSSDQYLAHALLDMSMDHSMSSGYQIASDIVNRLKRVTMMHKSEPQHASLAVLKAPDIPSMLVETGFITNPSEEKLLNTAQHQQLLANAIFMGVRTYYRQHPPLGTWYANQYKQMKYTVKSGDSLSLIAIRYGISVEAIKQSNKLSSSTLTVGQTLVIPKI
ncbi:N-acetylmuramoyl-L-alanine amidase [Celerinatantimonas sp. YJH-8]|uniref:N-acetylmuramoyl-L-alanine amidase n=1 Tax=Celerinatantimonas sp. YJH-8 TaxID=3228714 RepID=UPI0038C56164